MSRQKKLFVEEITEEPFVAVVLDEQMKLVCACCFKRAERLQHCSRCGYIYYCSKACQTCDWSMHKFECPRFRKSSAVPNTHVRMMARTLWKHKSNPPQPYRNFDELMSHSDKMFPNFTLYDQVISYMGDAFMQDEANSARVYNALLQLYGKLSVNMLGITSFENEDYRPTQLAYGLYLRLSVIDHSCDPNAWVYFDGAKAVLRPLQNGLSLHDLSKIRIRYIARGTKDVRQMTLLTRYYFHCQCTRCTDKNDKRDGRMVSCDCCNPGQCSCDLKAEIDKATSAQKPLATLLKYGLFAKLRKVAGDVLSACKHLGRFNHYRMLLIEYLFEACIGLQDWKAACEYGYIILEYYRFEYPANHPKLLFHLLKLSKVLVATGQRGQHIQILEEAERVCAQCFGKNHKLYKEINDTLAKQRAELEQKKIEGKDRKNY